MTGTKFLLASTLLLATLAPAAFAVDEYEENLKGKSQQYFRQGLQAEQAGDLHHAVEFFRKSIGQFPKFKEVHYKLAQDCATLGNNDEAMSEFRTAMNLDNNFVQCRNDYGLFLLRNKVDEKGAMGQWKICVQIDPKYPFPYYNMGLIYHKNGDLESAIENFETVTRLKPDFSPAFRELGLCIFERAKNDDLMTAQKALEMSAKLAPENPMVHYHLGFIYATQGDLDAAEAQYRTALGKCDPRLAAAHWELARVRYLRGDLDRCMAEIAEAQKINPTYTTEKKYPDLKVRELKTLNAKCIEYKGHLSQAIDAYLDLARITGSDMYAKHIEDLKKKIKLLEKERKKKPLTYDPEEIDALVAKGIDQTEDGDLDGARASFERAVELNPASVEALMGISGVQEAQGDLNGAVATNQKAILVCPDYDGLYYNLGFLLEKMNLPTDAGAMYDKFHQKSGKYPYDPQHVIKLQQDMIRQQKIEENRRTRGY